MKLHGTESVSSKVGETVESVVSVQQQIQKLDPNNKDDQKKLQELQAQAAILKIFMDKMKELEGDIKEMIRAAFRKGQAQ